MKQAEDERIVIDDRQFTLLERIFAGPHRFAVVI
jgi:hypothetical protein